MWLISWFAYATILKNNNCISSLVLIYTRGGWGFFHYCNLSPEGSENGFVALMQSSSNYISHTITTKPPESVFTWNWQSWWNGLNIHRFFTQNSFLILCPWVPLKHKGKGVIVNYYTSLPSSPQRHHTHAGCATPEPAGRAQPLWSKVHPKS